MKFLLIIIGTSLVIIFFMLILNYSSYEKIRKDKQIENNNENKKY